MFIHNWKKEIFTIPNLLSFFRLILIPVYISIYLHATQAREYYIAGAILAVSCLTDLIDGKIARKFNLISTVGKILDPVADKMTQFALAVCLSIKYPVLRFFLALFVVKESFQAVLGLINLRQGRMLPGALPSGKICTAVLFTSLIILVLMPNIKHEIVVSIVLLDIVFLCMSFLSYIFAYLGKNPKVQNIDE